VTISKWDHFQCGVAQVGRGQKVQNSGIGGSGRSVAWIRFLPTFWRVGGEVRTLRIHSRQRVREGQKARSNSSKLMGELEGHRRLRLGGVLFFFQEGGGIEGRGVGGENRQSVTWSGHPREKGPWIPGNRSREESENSAREGNMLS